MSPSAKGTAQARPGPPHASLQSRYSGTTCACARARARARARVRACIYMRACVRAYVEGQGVAGALCMHRTKHPRECNHLRSYPAALHYKILIICYVMLSYVILCYLMLCSTPSAGGDTPDPALSRIRTRPYPGRDIMPCSTLQIQPSVPICWHT